MGNIKEKIMKKKKIVFPIIGVIIILAIILIVKTIIDFNSPKIVLKDNKIVCMEKGKMKIDELVNIDNKTYYFDETGAQVKNRMIDVAGIGTAYFDNNGFMVKNKIINLDGKKYFLDEDGKLMKGEIHYNGEIYYTNIDGQLCANYVVCATGGAATSYTGQDGKDFWKPLDHKNCWLDCYGMIKHNIDSDVYVQAFPSVKKIYYDGDGGFIKNNCISKIDGKNYIFAANGINIDDKIGISNKRFVSEYSMNTGTDKFDTIIFGRYSQSSEDEKEPIEWIIVGYEGPNLKLLSKNILDKYSKDISSNFYDNSFNDKEKICIVESGGSKINLLTKNEYEENFNGSTDLNNTMYSTAMNIKAMANCTKYAKINGSSDSYLLSGKAILTETKDPMYSWLPGQRKTSYDTAVSSQGLYIATEIDENLGFRPKIVIDLAKYNDLDIKPEVIEKNNANFSGSDLSSRITNDIKNAKIVSDYYVDNTIEEMDTVKFGKYPQRDIEGKKMEDIEWLVLEKDEDSALLLSKYVLDKGREYYDIDNIKDESLYLPDGMLLPLRDFLNNIFLKRAFSDEEKELMLPCNHLNVTTNDLVTLPNYEDMLKTFNGFKNESEHKGIKEIITEYANNKFASGGMTCLSNFKFKESSIMTSALTGFYITPETHFVNYTFYRPIIRVKLKK